MNQLQFYKYATWALLLLNLSMIAFYFLTAPPRHHGMQDGRKSAIDILKMNEQQDQTFLQYAQKHMEQMDGYDRQQRDLLMPYFSSLVDSTNSIDSESLINQVLLLEQNKITSTYQHLQEVESILKPKQQANFEEFVTSALEIILLNKQKPLPPRRK